MGILVDFTWVQYLTIDDDTWYCKYIGSIPDVR